MVGADDCEVAAINSRDFTNPEASSLSTWVVGTRPLTIVTRRIETPRNHYIPAPIILLSSTQLPIPMPERAPTFTAYLLRLPPPDRACCAVYSSPSRSQPARRAFSAAPAVPCPPADRPPAPRACVPTRFVLSPRALETLSGSADTDRGRRGD